ncbi:hypothetical protein, partial [Rhodoblastus sp.]|uniref:hypothetical protein n=1 Tax=Rhodoblastus sp. TaxID=1962975 RepID=UPI00261AE96A
LFDLAETIYIIVPLMTKNKSTPELPNGVIAFLTPVQNASLLSDAVIIDPCIVATATAATALNA